MYHILIAPDSFKESLSATDVARYLKTGLQKALPDADISLAPISDGGDGFVEAMVNGTNGYTRRAIVSDALMRPVDAAIGFSPDGETAFIGMAEACGLERLSPEERNPILTSTFGVGQMMKYAAEQNCKKIIIGIGGSATNDGGAGLAQALGVKLLNKDGNELLPGGGNLGQLYRIDTSKTIKNLPEIIVACDVTNPLTGATGASAIYGPQKGATAEMVKQLDSHLKHFAAVIRQQMGIEIEYIPGSGAAGGLGGGLMAFTNARLANGFQTVADAINLEKKIVQANIVITGEGCIDAQTLNGKAPYGVALLARQYGKPVIGVAGTLRKGYNNLTNNGFQLLLSIINRPMTLQEAIAQTAELLEETGFQIGNILKLRAY